MSRSSDVQEIFRAVRSGARRLEGLRGASGAGPGGSGPARGEPVEPTEPTVSSTFLRGLVVGALVGAAIAGSTVWQRRRVRGRIRRELIEDGEPSGS
jgi:hypothetical protein